MARVVCETEALPGVAAARIESALREAAAQRPVVSLMLAGGSTPERVYQSLSQKPQMPWLQVQVFFGDERAVPPDHPDSNYRMARESLLRHVPIPASQIYRMSADQPDLAAAAAAYAALLPEALDVLILGVGEDGHTASLFPRAAALRETVRRVVPIWDSPKPPPQRLSVTPRVFAQARHCFVLASGANKARAVACALEGPLSPELCPAQIVRDAVWILDLAAAAELGKVGTSR